jgi:sugar phosphate isomerase/epimerase
MDRVRWGMQALLELGGLERQINMCSDLGLDFIELHMDMPDLAGELPDPDYLRDAAESKQVGFTVHLAENTDLACFHEPVRQGYRELCVKHLEWAANLGVPLVNMHLNSGVYFSLPNERVYVYEKRETDFIQRLHESFREIAEVAKEHGMTVCIENASGFEVPWFGRAIDLLVDLGLAKLTWDTGHDGSSGGVHLPVLMRHADAIRHMHLHDYTDNRDHLPLRTGNLDLDGAVTFAREHSLSVVIEVKALAELTSSVQTLRELGYL